MRGLSGLTLLLAGGLAGIYLYLPDAADRRTALDAVMGSRAPADAAPRLVEQPRRVFSPQTPAFQRVAAAGPSSTEAARHAGERAQAAAPARASDAPAPSAPAVVSLPASGSVFTAQPRAPFVARADSEEAQRELARSLQKELRRVGCYDGEINGAWTGQSKRAMKSFTERVNATLPVDVPDYILLTLVQGHNAQACGDTCPSGQVLAGDGQCLPNAIVAQAAKKSAKGKATRTAAAAPGRPGEAGTSEGKARATPTGDGWRTTTVVTAAPHPVASVQSARSAAEIAAAASPQPAAAPLPGRMAVGGPLAGGPHPAAQPTNPQDRLKLAAVPGTSGADLSDSDGAAADVVDGTRGATPQKLASPDPAGEFERSPSPRPKATYTDAPGTARKAVAAPKRKRVRVMHYDAITNPSTAAN